MPLQFQGRTVLSGRVPTVTVDFDICLPPDTPSLPSSPRPVRYCDPEEEIARGPACWLWDYLRRSGPCCPLPSLSIRAELMLCTISNQANAVPCPVTGAAGYLLPLSGGADSSSTAAIVGCMCQMVCSAIEEGDAQVLQDARRQVSSTVELAKPCTHPNVV